jgi:hypothetical protein
MATQPQRNLINTLVSARRTALEANPEFMDEIVKALPEDVHWKEASKVIERLKTLPCDARADEDIDAVRDLVKDIKDTWLRLTVPDIIKRFDSGGALSDKQREVLRRGLEDALKAPLEQGIYKMNDEYYRVTKTKADHHKLVARKLVMRSMGDLRYCEFHYSKDALYKLTPDMRVSEEEARAFGHKFKLCCNCGEPIGYGDKRGTLMSYAVGYGPVCASRNNWSYPKNVQEAIDICHRLNLTHPLLTLVDAGKSIDEAEAELSNEQQVN